MLQAERVVEFNGTEYALGHTEAVIYDVLMAKLASIPVVEREAITAERLADSFDDAIAQNDRNVSLVWMRKYAEERRRIDHALKKLFEHRPQKYGVCDNCEEEITPARLRIVPDAAVCVNCQGMRELRDKG